MKKLPEGDSVKKVVIVKEGFFTIFEQLVQSKLLKDLVKEVCDRWSLPNSEEYALRYKDTKSKIYVTEDNRSELRDGDILTVTLNFELAAAKSLSDIEQPDLSKKREALVMFTGIDGGQADDPLFAKEFIRRNGINTLVKIIESSVEPADVVAQAIAALQELMEHNFTSWDTTVNQDFVKKILSFANKTDGLDRKIIQRSLAMLESIVSNSSSTLYILVMNEVKLENLVYHIKRDDSKLQLSAMTLCNSVFMRMEHANRKKFTKKLSSKGYTEVLQKILASSYTTPLTNEMSHQLYVYQSLLLSLLEPRTMSRPETNSPDTMMATLNSIYTIAFESSASRGQNTTQLRIDFKNLGFLNGSSPLMDFEECPPGVLAYDVITYFARKHQDQYVKMILENSVREKEYECPFARCSQQVVKMLCELLNIGVTISETATDIQPMFFTTGDVFEELFCVSVLLLNKTWKEMKATTQDLPKVLGVVKDQIKRALNEKPDNIEKFKTKAFSLTYQQVLKLKQQEAQERTILDSKSKPVMELRESIEPEIRELVRQQRLAQLVNGQRFTHFSTKGKPKQDRQWFCCLSPNYRFLYYGNVLSNDETPTIEKLQSKIPLSDVTSIEIGKDAPHSRNLKRGGLSSLAFSVMYNQEDHLDFVAESPQVFSVWTDALLSLTGKEMNSREFQDDLDMLLNMEMKLLLLDLEDVRIPEVPPPIPREPENYNFYYRDD